MSDDIATIREESALLADWAEEPVGMSSVDVDEVRGRLITALDRVAARLAHLEMSFPSGSTDVQFCTHEHKCLELRQAELALDLCTKQRESWRAELVQRAEQADARAEAAEARADEALQQVRAVVDAARVVSEIEKTGVLPDFQPLADALAGSQAEEQTP